MCIRDRYASYTVEGAVRNTGPEDAVEVQLVLTAYDPLGRVIAMRKVTPEYNAVSYTHLTLPTSDLV